MTKPQFQVSVISVREVHDMPGSWTHDHYRNQLARLELEGVNDRNIREVEHG